jgi:hypothetical protein
MRAVEVSGVIDEQGQLSLQEPVPTFAHGKVRVIILYPESAEQTEQDPDDTPVEDIKASLHRALQQAKSGERLPLSQMWEGVDAE